MRALRVAFVTFALLVPLAAHAEEEGDAAALERVRAVAPLILAAPTATKALTGCPAARFGRRNNLVTRFGKWLAGGDDDATSAAVCLAVPDACWELCELGDGQACLDLARAFERFDDAFDPMHTQRLFALGCEMGIASGCTNRGASFRWGPADGDPSSAMLEADREACAFSLFETACREDDPWGCTMLGEAHQTGAGTAVDLAAARAAYARSCAEAPDFVACETGRRWAKAMDD